MARTGPSDGQYMRADHPAIGPGALFGDAFVGVVTTAEIPSLEEILDRTLGET